LTPTQHDVIAVEREVIDAEPARVYVTAIEADLAHAAHRSRAVAALLAARAAPTRLARGLRRGPSEPADPVRLSTLPDPGEWVWLDEDFGREIVFGAVGRVGSLERYWRFAAPLVSRFMRGVLRYIKEEAERPYSPETPPPSRAASRASASSE
jgi:hypothetical protein